MQGYPCQYGKVASTGEAADGIEERGPVLGLKCGRSRVHGSEILHLADLGMLTHDD